MIVVRRRTEGDLSAAVSALRLVHERDGYPVHWHEPADHWLTPAGMQAAWVAVDGGRLLGHAVVQDGPEWLSVGRLFVAVDARGRGVADLMLDEVEKHAHAAGRPLRLELQETTLPAIARYERRGWVRTDTHEAAWFLADGITRARAHGYRAPAPRSAPTR